MNASDTSLKRHGLARVLSKMGMASRTEAARLIAQGFVRVNERIVRDPEHPTRLGIDRIQLKQQQLSKAERRVLMLNKPRGLVCTRHDEKARATVYDCLPNEMGWLAPVGRLDKASEGLLLFTNDPEFAARITDSESGPDKTYHVQINRVPDESLLRALQQGVADNGEFLSAKNVRILRHGAKNAWLEIVLDEGRNRQIRRLLQSFDIDVVRLIRVSIGALPLASLAKGEHRFLSDEEIVLLTLTPTTNS
jgi:23S rRNA pseudouridine2605 synthase